MKEITKSIGMIRRDLKYPKGLLVPRIMLSKKTLTSKENEIMSVNSQSKDHLSCDSKHEVMDSVDPRSEISENIEFLETLNS